MADSEEIKINASASRTARKPPSFAEDLDSMLDDAISSFDETDALMDDEDALDKLLMENSVVEPDDREERQAKEDLGALFSDDESELDEIDANPFGDTKHEQGNYTKDEPVSDALSDALKDVDFEDSAFMAEIDEFDDSQSNTAPSVSAFAAPSLPEEIIEVPVDNLDEDFTLASFDITDDEDSLLGSFDDEMQAPLELDDTKAAGLEIEIDEFAGDQVDEYGGLDNAIPDAFVNDEEVSQKSGDDDHEPLISAAVSAQINQIFSELESIKQKQAMLAEPAAIGNSEDIEQLKKAHKSLKSQMDDKVSKLPVISYSALGTGVLGLILGSVATFLILSAGDELTAVSESVSTLEDDMSGLIAKSGQKEMDELKAGMEQLKHQVAEFSKKEAELATQPGATVPTAVVPFSALADAKTGGAVGGGATELQDKAVATGPVATTAQATEINAVKDTKAARLATDKPSTDMTPQPKPVNQEQPKKAIKPTVKKVPAKKPVVRKSNLADSRGWSVNLVAFRQDWYAERKAAEFIRQGIPVRVVTVEKQGETWYRLAVPGFFDKNEAQAYAERLKKTLNLDSVWVGHE